MKLYIRLRRRRPAPLRHDHRTGRMRRQPRRGKSHHRQTGPRLPRRPPLQNLLAEPRHPHLVDGTPMSLYLTPHRAALLQDIRDGDVHRDPYNTSVRYEYRPQWRNVTVRTAEVIAAGWAEEGERSGNMWPVRLTDAGRSVLEEWESRNG